MNTPTWPEPEAVAVLAAMKTVATANSELGPIERALIEAAAEHVFGATAEIDSLGSITTTDLAAAVVDEDRRATATQLLVLVPYADMTVEAPEVATVDAFAGALGASPASVRDLHRVRDHHINRLLADYGRRAVDVYGQNSPYGRVRTFARALRQHIGDAGVAARYQALADLPEGTLGREFFEFYRARSFPLPGEKHSLMGELLVTHDSSHILGGFNTDASGEIDVAGFEAGMSRSGFGYEMLLEVLLDFHLGVDFGASSAGIETKTAKMRPDTMMTGIQRGLDCTVDLIGDWDFWSVADQQVTDLRERYDIAGAGPVRLEPPLP